MQEVDANTSFDETEDCGLNSDVGRRAITGAEDVGESVNLWRRQTRSVLTQCHRCRPLTTHVDEGCSK